MKNQVRVTLAYLFIAALLGWLLRSVQSGWLLFNFKYLLHTHSHVALIGWIYNGCYLLIQHTILEEKSNSSWYNRLFWLTQITILGMLLSFPFQGYGAISITFSTLYIFASYALGWKVFRDAGKVTYPVRIALRVSVVFLFLSSIGPFALGYFMSQGMGDSIYYKLSIYWFLHFLYNGFFLFIMVGYAFEYFPPRRYIMVIVWSIALSTFTLFLLSALWTNPPTWVYIISFISSAIQLLAFGYWIAVIRPTTKKSAIEYWAGRIAVLAFLLKLIFQVVANAPTVQDFINTTVPYSVIGFIHLVMLGFFSLGLLTILIQRKILINNKAFRTGLVVFIIGIVLSEIMLFSQAIIVSSSYLLFTHFFEQLTAVSTLLPIGILFLLLSQFLPNREQG